MVIRHIDPAIERIAEAPTTGIWRMAADGSIAYSRFDYHRRAIASGAEAFLLRIVNPGSYRYAGADLGILVTRGRLMSNIFQLNRRASDWLTGMKGAFRPSQDLSSGRSTTAAAGPVSLPWSWFSGGGLQGIRRAY